MAGEGYKRVLEIFMLCLDLSLHHGDESQSGHLNLKVLAQRRQLRRFLSRGVAAGKSL
jgi:hypothetical protein